MKTAPVLSAGAVPEAASGGAGRTAAAGSAVGPGTVCMPGGPSAGGRAAATRAGFPAASAAGSGGAGIAAGAAGRVPAGPFGFLGAPGTTVYQLPQTQAAGLPWLGWNTQSLGTDVVGPVTWSLDHVSGPGAVTVYELGAFGEPVQLLGPGRSLAVPAGIHAHATWAFTTPGIYKLTMTQSATLATGSRSADTQVLTISVGSGGTAATAPGAVAGTGAGNTGCLPALLSLPAGATTPDALPTDPAMTTGTRPGAGTAPAGGLLPPAAEVPLWLWIAAASGPDAPGSRRGRRDGLCPRRR